MSSREGRGRPRRDYPARLEEKSGRGNNPPSRHLWVGNLSHDLTESDLAHYFLRYGDLESLAFQPGRSYAFVNYKNDEEAFIAVKELQGFCVAGNPLRIEFAKAEKSSNPPRDRRDEPHPMSSRDSPYNQRDSRVRNSSSTSEPRHSNKSRMNDEDAEPSEVLWIGFPAQLKVDEFILRKAFSPFGEIEKITAFPGRTYAFVRYRNVIAARRAKETLHGKLFGNPRVHICFAKNESGPSNRERHPINAPPSPRAGSYGRPESSEYFRPDRNDIRHRSPDFIPNLDPSHRSDTRFSGNIYERQYSPPRDIGARFREPSPLKFRPFYDDPWDLPEDVSLLHGTKKLKTDSFSPENELPEYDLEKVKHVPFHNIPQSSVLDHNFDPRLSGQRFKHDHLIEPTRPFGERVDHWNPSIENFQVNSSPLPLHDHRRLTPDLRESSSKQVWRWEGMIAKGGTPVCRARCFPVGKQMDFILPKYIDCTARTSLEMLAEHYYQAASAWVVFFVPANDPDIGYYNEFMNFLGEKQRAAVAKLDERTTLFLVPPSDFSEKVLKVPGKLSISGVVLRLDPNIANQNRETTRPSFQNDAFHHKPISPSQPYLPPPPPYTNYQKPAGNLSSMSNIQSVDAQGHDYAQQAQDYVQKPPVGPIWPSHDPQNANSTLRNYTSQAPSTAIGSTGHHTYTAMPRQMQESTHNNYTVEVPTSGNTRQPSMPAASLQAEQVAQLASSLLAQPSQSGGMSINGEYTQPGNNNQFGYSFQASQNYGLPNNQVSSEFTQSQFGQMQPPQQQSTAPQVNQQLQDAGQEDDAEADPQKRLQATLQLAAALLQQIQQGKGN